MPRPNLSSLISKFIYRENLSTEDKTAIRADIGAEAAGAAAAAIVAAANDATAKANAAAAASQPADSDLAAYANAADAAARRALIGAGNVNTSGAQSLSDKTLLDPILTGYRESISYLGVSGTNLSLNLSVATIFAAIMNNPCTVNLPSPQHGRSCVLHLLSDGVALNVPTFPGVQWIGGSVPAFNTTFTARNLYSFTVSPDTQQWIGSLVGSGGQPLNSNLTAYAANPSAAILAHMPDGLMRSFADEAALLASTPDFVGQLAYQIDDSIWWVAYSTGAAGLWTDSLISGAFQARAGGFIGPGTGITSLSPGPILTALGIPSYATLAAANAAITIGTIFFNTTSLKLEIATA